MGTTLKCPGLRGVSTTVGSEDAIGLPVELTWFKEPEHNVSENVVQVCTTILPSGHIEHGLQKAVALVSTENVPLVHLPHTESNLEEHSTSTPNPGGHILH